MKTQRHHNESGIALILTLTILAVILILLLAFITSMRTERIAAKAFNDLSKTKALAEGAVDEAVALLQSSMTNITPTTSYITAPGVVYTWSGGAWTPTLLYTVGSTVSFSNSIMGTYSPTIPIQVGWQKVPTVGPLVGRFAYWVDDDSTKVDLNTAQLRNNDPWGYTPAAIDLSQIFSSTEAGSITTYVATRPLDSIESIKLGTPSGPSGPSIIPSSFSNNEFFITANATSPDLTPWGDKRLNLTSLLGASPTPAQKKAAVAVIAAVLSTNSMSTWDGTSTTFANKYNFQQIAANIVDYITPDNIPTDSGGPIPAFLGLKQTPYLNELVISNTFFLTTDPINAPAGTLTISSTITAELVYMYTNTVPTMGWIAPKNTSIVVASIPAITILPKVQAAPILLGGVPGVTINQPFPNMLPGNGTLPGSTYATVVVNVPPITFAVPDTGAGYTAGLGPGVVAATFASPLGRMDYAQIALASAAQAPVPVSPSSLTLVWQAQCNDPRVKPISTPWLPIANGLHNTLGTFNTSVDMVTGSGTIPGDGEISCHIVSTPTRQRGTMYPSELAYIHTGIPWRTLYLEPQPPAEIGTFLPDWLAVDLFSATDIANVAGRMNINVLDGNPASPSRPQPLNALLGSSVSPVPNSISTFSLHNSPTLSSFVPAADKYFTTAGQICEVTGLADGGGIKSAREAPAWDIVNLVTPRSDTFTIWAVAQGIKKVPLPGMTVITQPQTFVPGVDLITGEVRIQAVVQRYEDPSTSPATVRFRTLYYRYIYQ